MQETFMASAESAPRIETQAAADGTIVISVAGELTMFSAPTFEATLVAAIRKPAECVVIDLTDCTFIDSTGLNTLVHANRMLDGGAARLALIATHPHLLRVLELTHVDDVLPIYTDRSAALNGHRDPRVGYPRTVRSMGFDAEATQSNGKGDTDGRS